MLHAYNHLMQTTTSAKPAVNHDAIRDFLDGITATEFGTVMAEFYGFAVRTNRATCRALVAEAIRRGERSGATEHERLFADAARAV